MLWKSRKGQRQQFLQIGKLWTVAKRTMIVLNCFQLCSLCILHLLNKPMHVRGKNFPKWSQKTFFYSKSWYLRIFGQKSMWCSVKIDKKRFSQNDLFKMISETSFSSICRCIRMYEQKTIFKCNLKKWPFSRNVDIWAQNDFFKVISK